MRWIGHLFFIVLYLLVTFFGLGPVLYADGVMKERIITALIVLVIYVSLNFCLSEIFKNGKKEIT